MVQDYRPFAFQPAPHHRPGQARPLGNRRVAQAAGAELAGADEVDLLAAAWPP